MADDAYDLGVFGEFIGSVFVDLLGVASYFVPGVGEALDVGTAPLNIWWVYEMMSDVEEPDPYVREVFSAFAGVEELAPFVDIIPSAILTWVYKWMIR